MSSFGGKIITNIACLDLDDNRKQQGRVVQHILFWTQATTAVVVVRSLTLNLNSRLCLLLTQPCDPPRDILFADYNHEQRRQQRDCLFGHIGSTVVGVAPDRATARRSFLACEGGE